MSIESVIERANARQAEADADLRQLAIDLVEGAEADDEVIETVARRAGKSLAELAKLLRGLERRKRAADEYGERDYGSEIAAVRAERQTLLEQSQAVADQLESLTKRRDELDRQAASKAGQVGRLEEAAANAHKRAAEVLGVNATGELNDWRD